MITRGSKAMLRGENAGRGRYHRTFGGEWPAPSAGPQSPLGLPPHEDLRVVVDAPGVAGDSHSREVVTAFDVFPVFPAAQPPGHGGPHGFRRRVVVDADILGHAARRDHVREFAPPRFEAFVAGPDPAGRHVLAVPPRNRCD